MLRSNRVPTSCTEVLGNSCATTSWIPLISTLWTEAKSARGRCGKISLVLLPAGRLLRTRLSFLETHLTAEDTQDPLLHEFTSLRMEHEIGRASCRERG